MRSKCFFAIITALVSAILAISSLANADLVGLDPDHMFIYDTDLNITWYNPGVASYRTWSGANEWAASLTVGGTAAGSWHLPSTQGITLGMTYTFSNDGSTPLGYNNTSSMLGHLYYTELGNKGRYTTTGVELQSGYGLTNKGPFYLYDRPTMNCSVLSSDQYWTTTPYNNAIEYEPYNGIPTPQGNIMVFDFSSGFQTWKWLGSTPLPTSALTLVYHEGRVGATVPEPAVAWLLVTGLLGIFGLRRKFKR